NTMILAGLFVALGAVIDDAIVDVDRLRNRLREARAAPVSTLSLIHETTHRTRATTLYATLIVILAVVPIFFMGGVSGAFFAPLATAFILAVVASMVVGLTVTPALALLLLSGTSPARESRLALWL